MKTYLIAVITGCLGLCIFVGVVPTSALDPQPAAVAPIPGDLVPLPILLPQPRLEGTPRNAKLPPDVRLDPEEQKSQVHNGSFFASGCFEPRGQMLVPKGTELLSQRKPVTLSDPNPFIGDADQVTDGDISIDDGSALEMKDGVQWVQIDLGRVAAIQAICLWHDYWPRKIYRGVIVQVADDAAFTKNVRTLFNNDHANAAGLGIGNDYEYIEDPSGKRVDAKGKMARYVRCYSHGNTEDGLNRYVEVSVFGTP